MINEDLRQWVKEKWVDIGAPDGKGGYIVTDWIAGKVFHVLKLGTSKTLATFPKGAADHAFIADKKILILPEMLENKVGAFDLSPLIK